VPRPIPAPIAWQAIAALAALFTLFSALADPVDLWRVTVLSRQGDPLHAVATLESLPEERITNECLSLGPSSDAPGSEPFLTEARLSLNATRTAVEIRTDAPVSSPTLALVLRVQCPGAFLYARHFSLLIPPQGEAIRGVAPAGGFRLKVGAGETVQTLAAAVLPGNRKLQRQLVNEVVAVNPSVFPDGRPGKIPAGTVLQFPDVRGIGKRADARPAPAAPKVTPAPAPVASAPVQETPAPPPPKPAPAPRKKSSPAPAPGEPIKLRRALELGERPGAYECSLLMPLCGGSAAPAEVHPELEKRAGGIESGMQNLKLKQDSIDGQLARLEASLAELQKTVTARLDAPVQAPMPAPKPEIRTVVKTEYKTEPIPWYFWLGVALAALAAAGGGFLFGRKRAYSDSLAESDDRLDQMLASAAHEMRDLDRAPPAPRLPPMPPPSMASTDVTDISAEMRDSEVTDTSMMETQVMEAPVLPDADSAPALESSPTAAGLSTDLSFEMDQALDNTRSMFTDVDRFIALGRTQNALSLLQFQVVKDPKDRDSWIKLMAIYRQEKMDAELEKALRDFRQHFPNDKAAQP
jgi:hypothetical protein